MTALTIDSMQGLYDTNLPTVMLSRGILDIAKVVGATGLSKGIIWTAANVECANLSEPIAHVSKDRARPLGRESRSKHPRQSPPPAIHNRSRYAYGGRMGTA